MGGGLVSTFASPRPRVASVGTAIPLPRYTQEEVADLLDIPEGAGRRFFRTSGIDARYLYLSPTNQGVLPNEDQATLLERHRRGALDLGREAINRCLSPLGLTNRDVDFLCCVSSTGLMLPGLSAMFIRHLGFRTDCQRIDIVGMGCNAALNGLNATTSWTAVHQGRCALMVCCEINSAIYVRDDRLVTSLVNSLFGDGCCAVLLHSGNSSTGSVNAPEIAGFSSHLVPDAWRAISYHWSRYHGKFELFLNKDIPKVLGLHSPIPISALLQAFALCRYDVKHWLVHAGGRKVITAIAQANGLTEGDLRHATSVLKQYGNLGSATVMFSYQELLTENVVSPGDYGMLVAMGPGATIETALLCW